ncbi:hypothetical protein B0H16DRAFT_1883323 [Mycena metata]|uniref:Uncharacterized protein n=1 Tax=Mycena metata TaxID=1033252 RepID=A0AAD7JLH9_9AGAR|nr:hypothetical protein B0H16DRAFT_1883323 [Mycena metata]
MVGPQRDGTVYASVDPDGDQSMLAPLAVPFYPSPQFTGTFAHDRHTSKQYHWTEYRGSPAVFTHVPGWRAHYGKLLDREGVVSTENHFQTLLQLSQFAHSWALAHPIETNLINKSAGKLDEDRAVFAVNTSHPSNDILLTWSGDDKVVTIDPAIQPELKTMRSAPPAYTQLLGDDDDSDVDLMRRPRRTFSYDGPQRADNWGRRSLDSYSLSISSARSVRKESFPALAARTSNVVDKPAGGRSSTKRGRNSVRRSGPVVEIGAKGSGQRGAGVGGRPGLIVLSNGQIFRSNQSSDADAALDDDPDIRIQIVEDIESAFEWYRSPR